MGGSFKVDCLDTLALARCPVFFRQQKRAVKPIFFGKKKEERKKEGYEPVFLKKKEIQKTRCELRSPQPVFNSPFSLSRRKNNKS